MNKNKEINIIMMIFISIVSMLISIYISLIIWDSLKEEKFKLLPIIIGNNKTSENRLEIIQMKKENINKEEFEELTKKLIKEYIKTRYSITGSKYTMQRDLGIGDKEDITTNGSKLKLPGLNNIGNDYNQSYKSFISGKNNDKEEIERLEKEKTTRSVIIKKEPYRYKDRWKTEVEFIYKSPTTNNMKEATRETWEINMEIEDLTGFRSVERVKNFLKNNPSALFGFKVKWIERIRK